MARLSVTISDEAHAELARKATAGRRSLSGQAAYLLEAQLGFVDGVHLDDLIGEPGQPARTPAEVKAGRSVQVQPDPRKS